MGKNRKILSHLITALLAACLTAAACFGALCVYAGGYDNVMRGAKLTQILHILDKDFVTDTDLDAAVDAAANGMIESLDDKWSYYMTVQEYSDYLMRTNNSYRGIGVTVSASENGFLIATVTRDTPAYQAGIKPDETIVSLNGEPLAGKTTEELHDDILALGDESFTLGILDAAGTEREVTLSTVTVYTTPVSYRMLDGDTGYIILKNFSTGCADDAIAAVDDLVDQGAKSLVFDVRYNGGGFVRELTQLLDYLLPEGDIFISRDRNGKEDVVTSDANCVTLPMAVLINSDSYSAAELFAAQLSEYGAAVTVGEATTGKARSQVSYTLIDGSAIHISHEAYLTSERRDLAEEGGIKPDVAVALDDGKKALLYYGQLPFDEDDQLIAAVDAVS
ncbi:MAG: S41 family peptidase [Oscillospiraceae bacterium]